MRLSKILFAAVLTLTFTMSIFAASSNGLNFSSNLYGSQFGGTGSSSAYGSGSLSINPLTNRATVRLHTNGIGGSISGANLLHSTNGGTPQVLMALTDDDNVFENGELERDFDLDAAT
ncbi:MAG: hypothetical protein ACTHQM_08430 [Thermoanaerobaculia bacterium]